MNEKTLRIEIVIIENEIFFRANKSKESYIYLAKKFI